MTSTTYVARRDQLETYFDRTAVEAWKRMTSDAPVGRVRATVRAGRDAMRETMLSWLPRRPQRRARARRRMRDRRARGGARPRGADSPRHRHLADPGRTGAGTRGRDWRGAANFDVGECSTPSLGEFDYVVAMDSLIHYRGRGHCAHRCRAGRADASRNDIHRRAAHAIADE